MVSFSFGFCVPQWFFASPIPGLFGCGCVFVRYLTARCDNDVIPGSRCVGATGWRGIWLLLASPLPNLPSFHTFRSSRLQYASNLCMRQTLSNCVLYQRLLPHFGQSPTSAPPIIPKPHDQQRPFLQCARLSSNTSADFLFCSIFLVTFFMPPVCLILWYASNNLFHLSCFSYLAWYASCLHFSRLIFL